MLLELEVDSILKFIRNNQLLSDIYLKCNRGDIIGLFGKNGSGKTTFLKIVFGTLYADRKFIKINGKVVSTAYKMQDAIRYLPAHTFLLSALDVEKTVRIFLSKEDVGDFFEDEIVSSVTKMKVSELSLAEKRYLEVKLILYSAASFILLDEPFNYLSPLYREKLEKIILSKSQKKGIIIADHSYRNVLNIANRILYLEEGYLRELKNKDELIKIGYLNIL